MAAKVVMLAVPTVLGVASIRVYTTSEAPGDGLPTREKLNIYAPLAKSSQVPVLEKPGLIESGVTAAREGVTPVFQAVKGACVSVKKGSVNLYHAGEDLYYYLKDPPPDFLPRFGTITMAGLLGMFLARKGSRLKKVAVPVGLMSAGASLCYPAQAVAVVKVTAQKVYAAGRWGGGAMSSLLSSPSQQPAAAAAAAAAPQAATAPHPAAEEAGPPGISSTLGTEVESTEDVPASDESVITAGAEEISASRSSAETPADLLELPAPAETELTVPAEDPSPAAEPVATKAPEDVSEAVEAQSALSVEPESLELVPDEAPHTAEEPPAPKTSEEPAEEPPVPVELPPPAEEPPAPAEVASSTEEPPAQAEVASSTEEPPAVAEVASSTEEPPAVAEVASSTEEPPAAAEVASSTEEPPAQAEVASSTEEPPAAAGPPPLTKEPSAPAVDACSTEAGPAEITPPTEEPLVPSEVPPSTEKRPAPETSDEPSAPVVSTPGLDGEQVASAEEHTHTPASEGPSEEPAKGVSAFKADPALMDFGQSSPEDDDLYSTRS